MHVAEVNLSAFAGSGRWPATQCPQRPRTEPFRASCKKGPRKAPFHLAAGPQLLWLLEEMASQSPSHAPHPPLIYRVLPLTHTDGRRKKTPLTPLLPAPHPGSLLPSQQTAPSLALDSWTRSLLASLLSSHSTETVLRLLPPLLCNVPLPPKSQSPRAAQRL